MGRIIPIWISALFGIGYLVIEKSDPQRAPAVQAPPLVAFSEEQHAPLASRHIRGPWRGLIPSECRSHQRLVWIPDRSAHCASVSFLL